MSTSPFPGTHWGSCWCSWGCQHPADHPDMYSGQGSWSPLPKGYGRPRRASAKNVRRHYTSNTSCKALAKRGEKQRALQVSLIYTFSLRLW